MGITQMKRCEKPASLRYAYRPNTKKTLSYIPFRESSPFADEKDLMEIGSLRQNKSDSLMNTPGNR